MELTSSCCRGGFPKSGSARLGFSQKDSLRSVIRLRTIPYKVVGSRTLTCGTLLPGHSVLPKLYDSLASNPLNCFGPIAESVNRFLTHYQNLG